MDNVYVNHWFGPDSDDGAEVLGVYRDIKGAQTSAQLDLGEVAEATTYNKNTDDPFWIYKAKDGATVHIHRFKVEE